MAAQERTSTPRRPLSLRSSGQLSRLKQRFQNRNRGQKVLRFEDLFRSKKREEPEALRTPVAVPRKQVTRKQPLAKRPQPLVTPTSHTTEKTATETSTGEEFINPFDDDPEANHDVGWAPDALDVAQQDNPPSVPESEEFDSEPRPVLPRKPIRSFGRRSALSEPTPAQMPEPGRLRNGIRREESANQHYQQATVATRRSGDALPSTGWVSKPSSPGQTNRFQPPATIAQRDQPAPGSTTSEIELTVPDPVPPGRTEPALRVPSPRRPSQPVSMRRTEPTPPASRLRVPPPTESAVPYEAAPRPTSPGYTTRSRRNAAIAARGMMPGFKGFCPVALRDNRSLVDSHPELFASHGQRTYYFSTAAARTRFLRNPSRYAPAANGVDVVELLEGRRSVLGHLDHAAWFHNRLYLFASAESLRTFNANPDRYANP